MNINKIVILLMTGATLIACNSKTPQLGKSSIDKVIGAMTREEKVRLLIGTGMEGMNSGDSAVVGETKSLVPGAAGTTYPIPRLGIPAIVLADGPAGLRINPTRENDPNTYYCTHFPIGTALASTWDTELVEEVGKAMGNEVLEYGADVYLAPALNIHRNPLCGRNFEYYSEDPLIAGKTAAAYVKGVQSNGVGTSIKHFAANNQESNRMNNDARVSPRALREIYLKGFEITVKESQPWTVMSSYNQINGVYTSQSPELLTTLLRDEWGFKGMVMTDWFGGKDPVAQMKAGNDMLQPGYEKQYTTILNALNDGSLDESVIDRNVRRVLELIVKSPSFKGYKHSDKPDLKAHAQVTRQAGADGMVLLKNENTLPLQSGLKVSLYGCTSYDFIAGGTGSGNVNRAYTVSLLEGLDNAGFNVDRSLKDTYREYIEKDRAEKLEKLKDNPMAKFLPVGRPEELAIKSDIIKKNAAENDFAVITIGRLSGEFLDRPTEDFELSKAERKLIDEVCNAFHAAGKKVLVILNIGGVIETSSWKNTPDAILCAWQAGQEGGNSVADVISGKVNPSGKLTMTFPVRFQDAASSDNFPTDGAMSSMDFKNMKEGDGTKKNWDYTNYEEDIFVGYRYFDSFGKEVSYPFGYGLSYTTFEYGTPTVKEADGVYTVNVDVRNAGKVAGREVVELYASCPDSKTADKPEKELKAYAKTPVLQPGETFTVTLKVNASDLASYNTEKSGWEVSEGNWKFLIGSSSRDIRCSADVAVKASFQQTNNLFAMQHPLNILTR